MEIPDERVDGILFVVTGASIRAETMDRPLAYRIKEAVDERLSDQDLDYWECIVLSDVWYLNNEHFSRMPTISIGGPGVNALSAYLYERLSPALAIDNVLLIQMDLTFDDKRCAVWGMDHDMTVEAIDTFVEKGYLDRFMECLDEE